MLDNAIIAFVVFIFICVMVWGLWNKEEKVEITPIELEKLLHPILPPINPDDFTEKGIAAIAPEDYPDPTL